MIARIQKKMRDEDSGFTLIELLIVIVILGILAAIVVFSVGGISDRGQASACDTDKKTVQTAEEAYFAQAGAGSYGTVDQLVTAGFLHSASKYYTATPTAGSTGVPAKYTLALTADGSAASCTIP